MMISQLLATRSGEVVSVKRTAPVMEVIALLSERRIGAVPVVEDGAVIGIMSERDVIYRLTSDGASILDWPVEKVMNAPVVTVAPDSTVLGGLALMTKRRIRHLPVVDNGKIVGIISIGDLVKARMDRIEAEAEAMRAYIQAV